MVSTVPRNLITEYDLTLGILYNGATINEKINMVENIGGIKKGSVELILVVDKAAKYALALNYLSPNINSNIRIAINEVDLGVSYNIPQTLSNNIKDIKVFNIVVNLNSGKNKIGIYGDEDKISPSVGKINVKSVFLGKDPSSIYSTSPEIILINDYNSTLGALSNGAIINEKTNFVDNIGGKDNGSVEVTLTVINEGDYNLALSYVSNNGDTSMKIDVNGIDTGKVYYMTQTNGNTIEYASTMYITITLKSGNNIIKFYGDGINNGPSIGKFSIKSLNIVNNSPNSSTVPIFSTIYDCTFGKFYNGADINQVTNLVDNLGGGDDGSVEVTVKCDTDGQYSLSLNYLSPEIDSDLKIDVNGVDSGEIYPISKTPGNTSVEIQVFNITLNLKSGENTLKFHGNKVNVAPSIGMFTVIPLYVFKIPMEIFSNSPITNTLINYEPSLGVLLNGAIINETTNFVDNIGGEKNGAVEVALKVDSTAEYILQLNYFSPNNDNIIMVDVNGIALETIYKIPMTGEKFQVFNINLNLVEGNNVIKFYGDIGNKDLSIGSFIVNKNDTSIKDSILYKPINQTIVNKNELSTNKIVSLTGSAIVKDSLITGIGGNLNGTVILTITIPSEGIYDFGISYVALDNSSKVKIDVNDENTGAIYEFDKTTSVNVIDHRTKVVKLHLKSGVNTIKIYS